MNEFPEKEPSQIGLAHFTMAFFASFLTMRRYRTSKIFDNAQG